MSIRLEQVSKSYANGAAICDVTVDIGDGEFFVLLGPSGSGKTTLLRAIAGLTGIDRGRIDLHGRDVTNVGARNREVGFVFQNYALFQHMTVADNIEFALCARRVPSAKRRERRRQLLALVALEGLDDRYPRQLSGGQQQRVAVARALAHEPRVLLLDEPFGALDAKIREELRRSIRRIQQSIGISTVLVTHDQEEAFSLADRIGVMDRGRLQEVGDPRSLYRHPSTRFVATFLGAANLLLGTCERGSVCLGEARLAQSGPSRARGDGEEVTVVIRPEDVELSPTRGLLRSPAVGTAEVAEISFVGSSERIKLTMTASPSLVSALRPDASSFAIDAAIDPGASPTPSAEAGQRLWVGFRNLHVLPTPISSIRLYPPAPAASQALADSWLVRELSARMRIEPVTEPFAGERQTVPRGLAVLPWDGLDDLSRVVDLLARGARQVLAMPGSSSRINRMLVSTDSCVAARDIVLSAAASFARHLDVDATMLMRLRNFPRPAARYKELLDLRDDSLRRHGLDVRTISYTGSLCEAVAAAGADAATTLLVVGPASFEGGSSLYRDLRLLLASFTPAALLLVAPRIPQPVHQVGARYSVAAPR